MFMKCDEKSCYFTTIQEETTELKLGTVRNMHNFIQKLYKYIQFTLLELIVYIKFDIGRESSCIYLKRKK